ncbi:hypothetical protein EDB83DRAFT_2315598 [Lactarius deliciosus]|nr:hypothetical protein EDB83DRAFT_2315598 [Lactarius deliciosus]
MTRKTGVAIANVNPPPRSNLGCQRCHPRPQRGVFLDAQAREIGISSNAQGRCPSSIHNNDEKSLYVMASTESWEVDPVNEYSARLPAVRVRHIREQRTKAQNWPYKDATCGFIDGMSAILCGWPLRITRTFELLTRLATECRCHDHNKDEDEFVLGSHSRPKSLSSEQRSGGSLTPLETNLLVSAPGASMNGPETCAREFSDARECMRYRYDIPVISLLGAIHMMDSPIIYAFSEEDGPEAPLLHPHADQGWTLRPEDGAYEVRQEGTEEIT